MNATVIPLRPFQSAITQAHRARVTDAKRYAVVHVLREMRRGENGFGVAAELCQFRLRRDEGRRA
jgi:hypothetical protein